MTQLLHPKSSLQITAHDDTDRVTPADRVPGRLEVIVKCVMTSGLDGVHGQVVQHPDALVYRDRQVPVRPAEAPYALDGAVGSVLGVAEPATPVTKVGADNEGVVRVTQVRQQQLAKGLFRVSLVVANQDGHHGRPRGIAVAIAAATKRLRQPFGQAVLVLIVVARYVLELARVSELLDRVKVHPEVAERRFVGSVGRQGAAGKIAQAAQGPE
ncbi:hypothetical protein PoMZ_06336 [Pyricularia oryzae]|uniref:Uncharacterized protein n=1 Tax=Pyricularia oryzae TaxID=318829 RepID=A0A4V1C7U8_PYROR|nr:hypothetical protein PoMZ_06336 [Pyricularia oryzae]